MRVLVVEDEARIASFLVKGLRAEGYSVEVVATGTEALARAESVDLITLDLGLPDMDGFEVLGRLGERRSHPPVIVLTARADAGDRERGLALGAADYLTKPFVFTELAARVAARLSSPEPPRQALA